MCTHRKGIVTERHSYVWGLVSFTGRQLNRGTSPQTETERGYPIASTTRTQSPKGRVIHADNVTPSIALKDATTKRNTSRDMVSPTQEHSLMHKNRLTRVQRGGLSHTWLCFIQRAGTRPRVETTAGPGKSGWHRSPEQAGGRWAGLAVVPLAPAYWGVALGQAGRSGSHSVLISQGRGHSSLNPLPSLNP